MSTEYVELTIEDAEPIEIEIAAVGEQGVKGDTATVAIGTVTAVPFPGPPTVTNSGTNEDAILNFGLVTGEKGNSGDTATIQVGTTQTLAPGSSATVTNSGTSGAAVFNFGIPQGPVGPMGEVSTGQLNAAITAALHPLRPVVVTQPSNTTGSSGDSLAISCLGGILPNTHLNLTYQWQISTDAGVSYSDITGATSQTIPFNPALVRNNGLYRCRLTNAYGTQDTNAATLTVDGSIRHLYGASDRGLAWDLDRMDHLYQTSVGATPVTAYGDPVGLLLTRERGGLDNLGSEVITNGDFANGMTGWSGSWSVKAGVASGVSGGIGLTQPGLAAIVGRTYRVSFTILATNFCTASFGGVSLGNFTIAQNVIRYVTAAATGGISIAAGGAITTQIDNISVREVPGIHLTQPTSSRRPTYARRPKTSRRNLVTQSVNLSLSPWTTFGSITRSLNGLVATEPATEITATSSAGGVYSVNQVVGTTIANQLYHFRIHVKNLTNNSVLIGFGTPTGWSVRARIDLTNGSVQATSNVQDIWRTNGWSVVANADGSFHVSAVVWSTANASASVFVNLQTSGTSINSAPTIGNSILVSAPQFELGNAPTAYQRVGNQFDVTEAGQPSINYLWFDGIDDCMQSATAIDFTNSDAITVSVGQRKLSDSGQRTVVGLGDGVDSANGTIQLTAPNAVSPSYAFRSRGTTVQTAEATGFAQPDLCVLTGHADISSNLLTLRRNGVQVASIAADQGTGNYANAILHLGSRAGTSLFFSGHINSGFIINRIPDPAILADYEHHWVATKAGVDLP